MISFDKKICLLPGRFMKFIISRPLNDNWISLCKSFFVLLIIPKLTWGGGGVLNPFDKLVDLPRALTELAMTTNKFEKFLELGFHVGKLPSWWIDKTTVPFPRPKGNLQRTYLSK